MNNIEFTAKLKELSACPKAIEYVGDMDFKAAWEKCIRADWMLWLICKMEIGSREERIHIICDCAATTLKYVPEGEDRPRLAIEAARKYADERTPENLERLNAAEAASWAVAGAASWAAAGAAGAVAWDAAGASWAAAGAAGSAAWDAAHKKMSAMIRKKINIKE